MRRRPVLAALSGLLLGGCGLLLNLENRQDAPDASDASSPADAHFDSRALDASDERRSDAHVGSDAAALDAAYDSAETSPVPEVCAWTKVLDLDTSAAVAIAKDAANGRLVVTTTDATMIAVDISAVTPSTKPLLREGEVPSIEKFSIVFDAVNGRFLIWGGFDLAKSQPESRTFEVDIGTAGSVAIWSIIPAAGSPPVGRDSPGAAVDATGEHLFVFGGRDRTTGAAVGDARILSFAPTPTWSVPATLQSGPSDRWALTTAFDPTNNRFFVRFGTQPTGNVLDLWSLTPDAPATWTEWSPHMSGASLWRAATDVYDPVGQALLGLGDSDDGTPGNVWDVRLFRMSLANPSAGYVRIAAANPPDNDHVSLDSPSAYDPVYDRYYAVLNGYWGRPTAIWSLPLGPCR